MNDFDRSTERVLSGLKDAETPPEMERRILAALRSHASPPPATVWNRLPTLFPTWLGTHARAVTISAACGLAAALVAVLIVPTIRHQNHVPAPTAQKVAPSTQPSTAVINDSESTPAPATQPVLRRATTHRAIKATLAKTSKTSQPSDDLAEIEMRAPSQPAPPMPLTDQEELLLRLVHARDPVELASLDRAAFMAELAKDKAQFDKFFEPPKVAPTTGEAQ